MTTILNVSLPVTVNVLGARTYAMACKEVLDLNDYANQVIVQQFVQPKRDDPVFAHSVVELVGDVSVDIPSTLRGVLLQGFTTFGDITPSPNLPDSSYTVYVVTYQSPDATNPTIKVVSKQ